MSDQSPPTLTAKRLGINTQNEAVIYIREDSDICIAEGFVAQARIRVNAGERYIIATLNTISTPLLHHYEVGLSEFAWELLRTSEGAEVSLMHPKPLHSLSHIRSKIYGNELHAPELKMIIDDVVAGRFSDIHTSAFVAASAGGRLNEDEVFHLTQSMVNAGARLSWDAPMVVDKHCVGGLPGNRTTPIIVSIIAAYGLPMPKTSSRAITSPAGTADTMEVLTPVELSMERIQQIVAQEHGCIVWGGAVSLSPADDILIRVERALNLDSEGQLVASVLSKKLAAGSTHVVIDIPVGPTAKVRDMAMAQKLQRLMESVGKRLGLVVKVIFTEGFEPVGRGIGPALEARDVLQVLQNEENAPNDLRKHALLLAGHILEFSPDVSKGEGQTIAEEILASGKAWQKFQSICQAQGGLRKIPEPIHTHTHYSTRTGTVIQVDTKRIALLAKLAGAPKFKAAGIDLHVKLQDVVECGQSLFTIHTESPGELQYTLSYLAEGNDIIRIEEEMT